MFFFPNPTSFCPNFGESCFTSSSQIPYPAPYFGQIPRIAFQTQNKYVLHLLLLNLNGQNVVINRIRFNAFGGGLQWDVDFCLQVGGPITRGFIRGGRAVYGTLLGPTKTQPYKLYRCNLDPITYLHLGVRNHE